jgi:hypothetical protein
MNIKTLRGEARRPFCPLKQGQNSFAYWLSRATRARVLTIGRLVLARRTRLDCQSRSQWF